ncbi:MAG: 50S ribosomal protein L18 [Actinomycetota bacterium]|nr:50S ribosomal protein L18 [Actinomycetota bacterium]
MVNAAKHKRDGRIRRHNRLRRKIHGTGTRPRLAVFRSNRHISAQIINDEEGKTIVSASSLESEIRSGNTGSKEAATKVGKLIGERAKTAGISSSVFDRGGLKYHGRVAAVAEAARESGLEF